MKRILSIALTLCMLLSCAVFFTGCSADLSGEWPVNIGEATISKEPENIVVLNDVFADVISSIGYDIKMVGRSEECDQDFLYIVPVVGKAAAPDCQTIASLQADLVIADRTLSAEAKSQLEANGATVATFDVPGNEDELKNLYISLGTALGGKNTGSEKGEKGYDNHNKLLSNMNTATSNVVQTVAFLYLDENNQLCTFVQGTLPYKFFNYNGNTNIFANQKEPLVNPEELRLGSPNYLFYDNEAVLAYLSANENLNNLNALKNNRACQIPRKSFERYGASAEEAVYQMLSFIEKDTKATPDEADAAVTAGQTAPASTAAPAAAAAPAATTAPAATAAGEAAQDDDVITFSAQGAETAE